MPKHNNLVKKIKKQFLSANDSIESLFNQLNIFILNFKKTRFNKNSKVILALGVTLILILSYFLIPTVYDKKNLEQKIKNQILKKYQIDINFNKNINYSLLPRPHFTSKNATISRNKNIIADIENLKIFIAIDKFFYPEEMEVEDVILDKAELNIKKTDFNFFQDLLNIEPSKNEIIIQNSKMFYKNENDEVLFINKINNTKFYYDSNNLENVLISKNEIFNVPYKLLIKNDRFNKKIFSNFKSNKIRLNIENEIDYQDKILNGLLEISFVNKSTSLNYDFKKNSLSFKSDDTKNTYNGKIDLKPFYFNANFNYDGLSLKNFFEEDSILTDLIKSELLNNQNLNININVNVKDIVNISEFNNLYLKIDMERGNISNSDSSVMWKDDLKITLSESLLSYDQEDIYLIGKIAIDMKDAGDFYKSFQIKKNYRKDIKKIEFDFNYNFTKKKVFFDNVFIDSKFNSKVEVFLEDFNSNEKKILNKIRFKNFVNNFFAAYAG